LNECFQEFASELHKKGITHVVVLLTKRDLALYYKGTLFSLYEAHGITVIHYPIHDLWIPKDIKSFIEFERKLSMLLETHTLLIHCRGGIGRTGLVTAGLFIAKGITPDRAIQMVRIGRNGSVQTFFPQVRTRISHPTSRPSAVSLASLETH
jgi:protein-tyrosine phosphatase